MTKSVKKRPLTSEELLEAKKLNEIYKAKKKELNLNQLKVGDLMNISQGAVNHYLNGINALNYESASQFAKILQVPVSDFSPRLAKKLQTLVPMDFASNVGAKGNFLLWDDDNPLPDDEYVLVNYYKDVCLAAGDGSFDCTDYNEFKLAFARSTLRKCGVSPSKAVCMTIKGDSMEPVLPDGATVGVNLDRKRIINNEIYAFRHSDVLRIKQLSWNKNNTINIHSFNSSRKDETAYLEEMEIIGHVFTWSVIRCIP
ncbi:repressor protein cI [Snodgrassella communis]|uniref:S24 family peptidase n=1 Tax=Snodgrassella communis TaxID=2946699 RepID=UPI000460A7D3|nr:S24 family peptidase [Snodgrassella communis]KDN12735.1 repressor protein cI [Snodgrassella communis]